MDKEKRRKLVIRVLRMRHYRERNEVLTNFLSRYDMIMLALKEQTVYDEYGQASILGEADIAIPIYNQMRCAAMHLLLYVSEREKTNTHLLKAYGHIERCYYDLQEVKLLSAMHDLCQTDRLVDGNKHIVRQQMGEQKYMQLIERIRNAHEYITSQVLCISDRKKYYEGLIPHIESIQEYVKEFKKVEQAIICAINEKKRSRIISFMCKYVLAPLVPIGGMILRLVFRKNIS